MEKTEDSTVFKGILFKQELYDCECIACGLKVQSAQHCKDITCPMCGSQMRRAERPGPGQE